MRNTKDTVAFHIARLYRDFLSYTSEELKKLGLSYGQLPLILFTAKHPGCTQAELTKGLRLDWGYSQRSVTKLVMSGFMNKEYTKEKAGNCLSLTEKGQQAFELSHGLFYNWDSLKSSGLSHEEKETLVYLLSKITQDSKESVK